MSRRGQTHHPRTRYKACRHWTICPQSTSPQAKADILLTAHRGRFALPPPAFPPVADRAAPLSDPIATFHEDISITNFIRSWKGYLAKTAGIQWQAGFFDHRLRSDASFSEKAEYIRQNPVRAGLVESSEDWPHLFQG